MMNKQGRSYTMKATIHERYETSSEEKRPIYFIGRKEFPVTNCDGDKLSGRRISSTKCYCMTFVLVLCMNHASAFIFNAHKRSNGGLLSSPRVRSFGQSSNYQIIQQYVNGLTESSDLSSKEKTTRTTNSVQQQSTLKRQKRKGLLSPWHILYRKRPDDEGFRRSQTLVSRRRSLDFALLLIKKALVKISKVGYETRDVELINILNENSKLYNGMKILRLEVPISSSALIDPLAWLTAQEEYLLKVQSLDSKPISKSHSMFYLNTHEKSMEVAAIGNALQWNATNQLWNAISDVLPSNSFVYGGSRFDHHSKTNQQVSNDQKRRFSKEWEAFGEAFWMLPMIELRQKSIPETSSTLAIHLVCPNNGTQWSDAARFMSEKLIQFISSTQVSRIAPTTLPPILSRSTSQRNTPMDGQELYENAFEAARIEFSKGSNSSKSSSNHLKKVVLARQQTFQFGTSFRSSLDIIRRWKYGGHEGGHLFWLKPPQSTLSFANSVSYEFLGCTPERLFQIIPQSGNNMKTIVRSEALAGTRPRGSTQVEDEMLLQDLWTSPKDRLENMLTAEYIQGAFDELYQQKLIKEPRGAIWKEPATVQTIETKEMEATKPRSQEVLNAAPLLAANVPSMWSQGFFVRRLLHLQHICQSYTAELVHNGRSNSEDSVTSSNALRAAKFLMSKLHPTPAVCGVPTTRALQFIEDYESIGFDRGFYAGPIGYIGHEEADIFVAIRSGLAITSEKEIDSPNTRSRKSMTSQFRSELSVYAGGGIVQDSKLRDEWAETNYKFAVIASLFPQSPVTLRSATTPNVAWATAFIEELVRNGITRFYVCPGSRSTPLVVAISRATRANSAGGSRGGTVQAISVLDERSAAFRALGYARGTGQPAAVVTSSGTAVANLYPAVIEAGMEGTPMLLLTADRPYESRDSGANQAIDQVKIFSSSYVRWFRDVLPPSDDVPVSLALSDASHAVSVSRERRGPVHLNLQFRENLAPETGRIRNDDRIDSITKFNGMRFTDVPGFQQWSTTGNRWFKSYHQCSSLTSFPVNSHNLLSSSAVLDVVNLIKRSRRGIIVVGNLRLPSDESLHVDQSSVSQTISDFADLIGFPIFAGVQSGNLRFISSSVVPFAEHILKCPVIMQNLAPDLIIQIGAPLVSTGVAELISSSMKLKLKNEYDTINPQDLSSQCHHVLIHPHSQHERSDPSFTVTHRVSSEITPFLAAVSNTVSQLADDSESVYSGQIGSELSPIIHLGRKLQAEMKSIVNEAAKMSFSSSDFLKHGANSLTEPQIIVGMSEVLNQATTDFSLFLSNSMPVRDAEFFLYPYSSTEDQLGKVDRNKMTRVRGVGVNRGASGIDGIISSALGYCEAMQTATTLLIGDVAALHDIGSLHSVVNSAFSSNQVTAKKRHPLATVIVNNDGGGIFSFLPIAQFGNDVGFDEFFGTPTNSFSFQTGAKAFGLPVEIARDYDTFVTKYREIVRSNKDVILEAVVASRDVNVAVHKHITSLVQSFVNNQLNSVDSQNIVSERVPVRMYSKQRYSEHAADHTAGQNNKKVALLLHGWMGDKSEWDKTASNLIEKLNPEWILLAVDLPGHGGSMRQQSQDVNVLRNTLNLFDEKTSDFQQNNLNINSIAEVVLTSLSKHHHITQIDAIAGYSLGGRVALAMKQLSTESESSDTSSMISPNTALILLGANPGDLSSLMLTEALDESFAQDNFRGTKDDILAERIQNICDRVNTFVSTDESVSLWNPFLESWYSAPIWGSLKERTHLYNEMVAKRARTLNQRGRDLAAVLSQCSPTRNNQFNWEFCSPDKTLYIAGKLDPKYSTLGAVLQSRLEWRTELVNGAGHALLVEAPGEVSDLIADFLCTECTYVDSAKEKSTPEYEEQIKAIDLTPPSKYNEPIRKLVVPDDDAKVVVGFLELRPFSVTLYDSNRNDNTVFGIGWGGSAKANDSNNLRTRDGFIIQLDSANGVEVGIGEVSPLSGLHAESRKDAQNQLSLLKDWLDMAAFDDRPAFSPRTMLSLDGSIQDLITEIEASAGVGKLLPSVRGGLEMCILALSSQKIGQPLHRALMIEHVKERKTPQSEKFLVSGLITRSSSARRLSMTSDVPSRKFPSVKVKVGHQDAREDAIAMLRGFQGSQLYQGRSAGYVRADANRAWNESQTIEFALTLEGIDVNAMERIEFIEEPLQRVSNERGHWSLAEQVEALEKAFLRSGIPYALDESIAEVVAYYNSNFTLIAEELSSVFLKGPRGCVALILKPALIGFELSNRVARLSRTKLGIGAVYSSCFDSGVGLAYTAFLANVANQIPSSTISFPHGIGTFTMLESDTMAPAFESFVNENGILNIPSLSRALYGLSLDEIRDSTTSVFVSSQPVYPKNTAQSPKTSYEASTATSNSGKEISVVVSLSLPFSSEIACSRFTDLPSMSRWSPWISSVQYQGTETEWSINIRGIPLKWRAESRIVSDPYPGIQWQSVSGLSNRGIVEFIPVTPDSCTMNVRMTIVTPRLLKPLFQGTSIFVEEFLRDKLLKWSLEMFRDVVKADLAIERGDVELGDALIGAVEGKASAIEATLNSTAL